MAVRLVPQRPAVVETSTPRGAQCPGNEPTAVCSTTAGPDATTPDAFMSLRRRSRHPGALVPAKGRFATATPNDSNSTIQGVLPPTSPTRPRPGFRPAKTRVSRHRPSALPPMRRLPAGIHGPTQEPLDLRTRRLFTGCRRPPAACQLLQLNVTRARHRTIRSPARARQAARPQSGSSTNERACRAFSGQGSFCSLAA